MAELEEWRVFIRDFSDLVLVRIAKELRAHSEDKPYLDEVLRELGKRSGQASGNWRPPEKAREYGA